MSPRHLCFEKLTITFSVALREMQDRATIDLRIALACCFIFVIVWISQGNRLFNSFSRRDLTLNSEGCARSAKNMQRTTRKASALLYSSEGHDHVPLPDLDDEKLAPFTRWVQTTIYKLQHPTDCSKSEYLLSTGDEIRQV